MTFLYVSGHLARQPGTGEAKVFRDHANPVASRESGRRNARKGVGRRKKKFRRLKVRANPMRKHAPVQSAHITRHPEDRRAGRGNAPGEI